MSKIEKSRQKPNWNKIKQEYFDSDIDEIQGYLKAALGLSSKQVKSGYYIKETKGWKDGKAEYKSKIYAKAQEKIINNPNVQNQVNNLLIAMQNVEKKVAKLIGDPDTKFTVDDLNKIKVGYEMLRLATGKSTNNVGGDKLNPLQMRKEITINLSKLSQDQLRTYLDLEKKVTEE